MTPSVRAAVDVGHDLWRRNRSTEQVKKGKRSATETRSSSPLHSVRESCGPPPNSPISDRCDVSGPSPEASVEVPGPARGVRPRVQVQEARADPFGEPLVHKRHRRLTAMEVEVDVVEVLVRQRRLDVVRGSGPPTSAAVRGPGRRHACAEVGPPVEGVHRDEVAVDKQAEERAVEPARRGALGVGVGEGVVADLVDEHDESGGQAGPRLASAGMS